MSAAVASDGIRSVMTRSNTTARDMPKPLNSCAATLQSSSAVCGAQLENFGSCHRSAPVRRAPALVCASGWGGACRCLAATVLGTPAETLRRRGLQAAGGFLLNTAYNMAFAGCWKATLNET